MDHCKKLYKNKNEDQLRGFALDILEKHFYTTNNQGWTAGDPFSPYDISGNGIYADFKLCSKGTVTISANECMFGDHNDGYFLFIYRLDKNPNVAIFEGGISYKDIYPYLNQSRFDNGQYAWLSSIRHLIA